MHSKYPNDPHHHTLSVNDLTVNHSQNLVDVDLTGVHTMLKATKAMNGTTDEIYFLDILMN